MLGAVMHNSPFLNSVGGYMKCKKIVVLLIVFCLASCDASIKYTHIRKSKCIHLMQDLTQ